MFWLVFLYAFDFSNAFFSRRSLWMYCRGIECMHDGSIIIFGNFLSASMPTNICIYIHVNTHICICIVELTFPSLFYHLPVVFHFFTDWRSKAQLPVSHFDSNQMSWSQTICKFGGQRLISHLAQSTSPCHTARYYTTMLFPYLWLLLLSPICNCWVHIFHSIHVSCMW